MLILAGISSVSLPLKTAVEKVSLSSYHKLQGSNIDKFLNLYRGHHVHLLRHVVFNVQLPERRGRVEEPLICRETTEEVQVNNELFTHQISDLFTALKTVEEREADAKKTTG